MSTKPKAKAPRRARNLTGQITENGVILRHCGVGRVLLDSAFIREKIRRGPIKATFCDQAPTYEARRRVEAGGGRIYLIASGYTELRLYDLRNREQVAYVSICGTWLRKLGFDEARHGYVRWLKVMPA